MHPATRAVTFNSNPTKPRCTTVSHPTSDIPVWMLKGIEKQAARPVEVTAGRGAIMDYIWCSEVLRWAVRVFWRSGSGCSQETGLSYSALRLKKKPRWRGPSDALVPVPRDPKPQHGPILQLPDSRGGSISVNRVTSVS